MLLGHLSLLFLFVALVSAGSSSSSSSSSASEEKRFKNKRDKCAEIVEISDSGECILITSLKAFAEKIEIEAKIKAAFLKEILAIEKLILKQKNDLKRFVIATYKLKTFFIKYEMILTQIQYFEIGSWGLVNDLFVISTEIQGETSESVIVGEDGGDCEIIVALEKAKGFFPMIEDIIDEMILELNVIFKGTLTYAEKMAKCGLVFKRFREENAALSSLDFMDIGSWGSFSMFYDVTAQYERIDLLPKLFERVPGTNCLQILSMFKDLKVAISDESFKWSAEDKYALEMFINDIIMRTEKETLTKEKLLKVISKFYYRFLKFRPEMRANMRKIKIGGGFGSFGAFIDMCVFVSLEAGRSAVTSTVGTTAGGTPTGTPGTAGTPLGTTGVSRTTNQDRTPTEAPGVTGTPLETTQAATSKPTSGPGNCNDAGELFDIKDPILGANSTLLIKTYYEVSSHWVDMYTRNTFWTFIYQISAKFFVDVNLTAHAKLLKVAEALEIYMGTSIKRRELVLAIDIPGWGSNKQLCDCLKK
ncbi:hypothetical protein L596_024670 [Steinernema carpocapsae]|uniref:Uncharacterized protein n=1 Tax=Steinernema carpocapsae TaxID=34508 RepID=A0A4U5M5G2_STECR|nr:hypothetical protein L596_024670 [Steinernema carpocapsae]